MKYGGKREIFVSTGSEVVGMTLSGEEVRCLPVESAEALCVSGKHLFCACSREQVIWRADRHTLMPQAVCPGGPGMCDLCCSDDGTRLYTLLGEADSVLMSDARTGSALIVNRCGCNPRHMMLSGGLLLIAGGEDGCVHGLDEGTLETRFCLNMPGPVCDIAIMQGRICALCRTPMLSSLLVMLEKGEQRTSLALDGMPGCLHSQGNLLLAATQGWLYAISADGRRIIRRSRAPGRAAQMCVMDGSAVLLDALSERLFVCSERGEWRMLLGQARAMTED